MSDKVDSSDEEAPESVSFGKSRETAINVLKTEAEPKRGVSHKQKRAKDEKRKRRQDKKDNESNSKVITENLKKLDNLRAKAKDALSEATKNEKKNTDKPSAPKNTKKVFEEHFVETNELEENVSSDFIPLDRVKTKSKRTSRAIKVDGFSDLKVEVIASKKPKVFAADSVLNFRETMLYGAGSRVKRESSKIVMARREKLKLSGKNLLCTK